ncbi:MAG TPA: amino acid adenylation domain-containing protein [Kofleriaceae bacterium]|nr:amino acid adenylation domain-containing protein [Kofleriaceae bacterium]
MTDRSAGLSAAQRALLRQAMLRELAGRGDAEPVPPREGPVPLTAFQRGVWLASAVAGEAAYVVPVCLRLRGRLDAGALAAALRTLVARHEALRTVIELCGDEPCQRVLPELAVELIREEVAGGEVTARLAGACARAADLATQRFELDRGPLVRAALYEVAPDDHVLALAVHHVIADGASIDLLVRELLELHDAAVAGRAPSLSAASWQLQDVVRWTRARRDPAREAAELDAAAARLAGAEIELALRLDRARPARRSHRGARISLAIAPATLDALAHLARDEGATLFMALAAGTSALIGRLAGTTSVLLGFPVTRRERREHAGVVGPLMNTLVLRGDLAGSPSFRTLLRRTRDDATRALRHPDVPFAALAERLDPGSGRRLDRPALCAIYVTLEDAPAWTGASIAASGAASLRVEPVALARTTMEMDLVFGFVRRGGALELQLGYHTDVLEEASARRIGDQLRALLDRVAAAADAPIAVAVGLAPGDEAVLARLTDTARPYPRDEAVFDRFASVARHDPDAPAVVDGALAVRYGELAVRARRLAARLAAAGIGREHVVALALPRSADLVVAMLGCLAAGAAYLPLDLGHPETRLRFQLADAGARAIVSRGACRLADGALAAIDLDRLDGLDGLDGLDAPGDAEPPFTRGAGDALACIFYTSGSSGTPKGVAVVSRGIVRLVCNAGYVALGPGDRVALANNPAFDAVTFEVYGALLNGGCVVVADPDVVLDAARLRAWLRDQRISAMFVTTSLFNQVVRQHPDAFATLRHVVVGGEALSPRWCAAALAAGLDGELVNGYGPTESTTFAVTQVVRAVSPGARSIPIGAPIGNTRAHVLDGDLRRVPVGAVGELYLAGDGLARGYVARPALTADRFVPDPYSPVPGGRMYRTGDRARVLPDATLEFLGRADAQVKLRGHRIEPGEIEAALAAHPAVRDAAVVPRSDGASQQLVAYVVARPGQVAAPAALRDHLRVRLPDYMVPAAFVALEQLPLTANGKLDRRALPAPVVAGSAASPPRTPLEAIVAAAFTHALDLTEVVAGVGRDDDFFELGGHSLRAALVSARLRRLCGAPLAIRAVFEHPTVARLAAFIAAARRGDAPARPPLAPAGRGAVVPASPTQARLWLLDQLQPGQSAYHVPVASALRGPLDERALAAAVSDLVRRHEVLRTRYRLVDGELTQVIDPPAPVAIARDALGAEDLDRRLAALAARPFDLASDWPLRVHLVRRGDADHLLLLVFHHIAVDGGSLPIIARELAAAYAAARAGSPLDAAPAPLQVADVAIWQRRLEAEPSHARSLAYWTHQLAGPLPQLALPPAAIGAPAGLPGGVRRAAELHRFSLPPPVTRALDRLGREAGATRFMTALATFVAHLARIGGTRDVIVGIPSAGREDPALDGLIGAFINTLAVRIDASGRPSLRELVARVRAVALDAYDHAAVPFERVVEALGVERDPARNPVFDVMFAFDDGDGVAGALALDGLDARPVEVAGGSPKLALELSFRADGETWLGYLRHDPARLDAMAAARLARSYVQLVEAAVAATGAGSGAMLDAAPDPAGEPAIDDLPLVSPGEAAWIVAQAHGRAVGPPGSLIAAIDQVAARRHDEVAVVDGGRHVRYGELIAWSHAVARRLAALALPAEARVVLVAERSAAAVAALLGALRAGVTLVSLDPETPVDRMALLCDDAAPRHALISHARLVDAVASLGVAVTDVSGLAPVQDAEAAPLPAPHPSRAACVLYTSGSTGRPKGVVLTHAALAWYIDAFRALTGLTERDRVLQFASLGFDASLEEILSTLAAGARLVLRPPGPLEAFPAFADRVRREAVTVLDLPTVFWHEWMRAQARGDAPPPASTRLLLVAGEAAALEAYRTWCGVAPPGCAWINAYGPTEITCLSTALHLAHGAPLDVAPPIGRPLAGAQAFVLDDQLALVPPGVAGELYLGGPGLARGYLGQPGLTAERFVPSPFHPGERLYRTGDRAVLAPDGDLHFLGRRDLQVKLRGVRVELAEVEAALAAVVPGARAAAVVHADERGAPELVGYLVPPAGPVPGPVRGPVCGPAIDLDAVRGALARRLPAAMLPAALVVLDAFPITTNGKIDRARLPRPARPSAAAAEPIDPLERLVLEIWRDVLGRDQVGTEDSFFAAGGHSLLAARVVARVGDLLGLETSIRAVFEAPRVSEFAAQLAARHDRARLNAVARVVLEVAGIAWTDRVAGAPS